MDKCRMILWAELVLYTYDEIKPNINFAWIEQKKNDTFSKYLLIIPAGFMKKKNVTRKSVSCQ